MRAELSADPGSPDWPIEDFAAAAPGAAVLLDGATTCPPGADTGCAHGVAWYARTLGTALLAAITAAPPVPLADALAAAISDVRARHEGTCDLDSPATPAATVTAVRASPDGISYLALSDSTIAAGYHDGRPPVIISDGHRPASTSPAAARTARTGIISRKGLLGIALLSDGATRITDRYGLIGWPGLLGILRDHGGGELIRQVRQAEAADPAGERWPRTKIGDDATAIWLTDI